MDTMSLSKFKSSGWMKATGALFLVASFLIGGLVGLAVYGLIVLGILKFLKSRAITENIVS